MEKILCPEFTKEWNVFAAKNVSPEDAGKTEMDSETLILANGERVCARKGLMNGAGELNLKEMTGMFEPESSAAVVTCTFEMPETGFVLFGTGADWWLEEYIDGNLSVSTLKTGNGSSPSIYNNLQILELKKGKHFFSAYVRAGGGGWVFTAGCVEPTEENIARIPERFRYKRIVPENETVLYGPWISHPNPGGIRINFVTDGRIPSGVDYRKKGTTEWIREWDLVGGQIRTDREHHNIDLTNLEKDCAYEYRVVMLTGDLREIFDGGIHEFHTFTDARCDFRFFVTGDTQFSKAERMAILEDFRKNTDLPGCDFFVHLGDIGSGYDNFADETLDGFISFMERPDMNRIPLVPVRGNHEYRGRETNHYFRYFSSPEGKSYYTFQVGKAFFMVLDSGEDKPRDPEKAYMGLTFDKCLIREQRNWMRKVVETPAFREAEFRIIIAHSSPYGQGEEYMADAMRSITDEFFGGPNPRYRLHLYLTGHIHHYLRTIPNEHKIASLSRPRYTADRCENCPYPILMTAGPGKIEPQISGFDCVLKDDVLTVRSVLRTGGEFERIAIRSNGETTVSSSEKIHLYDTETLEEIRR